MKSLLKVKEEFTKVKDNIKGLRQLLIRISKMKFFDPACGSGNFLIIAYKELRKLEILIWKQISTINKGQYEIPFVNIQLNQFYGIEIDDFAHEVAMLSLWLAEHQMNCMFTREFANVQIPSLPLRTNGNIIQGNACRVDWNEVCPHKTEEEVFVMGNPPYFGARLQKPEHKSDMEYVFRGITNYNNLDYIACWFYKGGLFVTHTAALVAFVTTNSICQGEQVYLLWDNLLLNTNIVFAYNWFKWSNNAKLNAGVTCTIIGISDKNSTRTKYLFSTDKKREVTYINAYLTSGSDVIVKPCNKSISKLNHLSFGNMANDGGALLLNRDEKNQIISTYPSSAPLIRRLYGALEFIRGEEKYCLWITEELKDIAYNIAPLRDRINKCERIRKDSKRMATNKLAKNPYLFAEIRHQDTKSIIIPSVSSEKRNYIPIGFLTSQDIIVAPNMAIYDAPMWLFGLLTSKMHMAWVKTVGGRLETRYRYSAQLCYNTFPFPKISAEKKKEIEAAAEEVLLCREDYPDKTLADLYDPDKMPDNLRQAHHALDLLVESCYQDTPFESDEERLECLFKLYEKMTKKENKL